VIRVSIVAASPLARAGLENVLTARGVKVVGSSADVESIAEQLFDTETDVVLVEASGEQAESVLESIVRSELASDETVVVLTDNGPPAWPAQALRAGIRGVLPGDVSPEQLISALEAAASGLLVVHPAEVDAVLPEVKPASSPLVELAEPLTRREREVLQMLAGGLGNKEIASRLVISEHTVKFHVASILGKLGAGSRTEAVSLGIRRGLVLL
jgi:two-component system, NarL family, response regulator YdfI